MQKLEERVSAFKKRRYEAKDQQKWSRILTTDFMSSEESGSEDGEEINIVMELPWRSSLVDEFFQSLDSQLMSEKSAKAKQQTKGRVKGQNQLRPAPGNAPGWALCVVCIHSQCNYRISLDTVLDHINLYTRIIDFVSLLSQIKIEL